MSIQLAAKHLAAHGRGPDTTLVHMTPAEVASLQSLAQQHGGSLSINPQTGLPEAGFLSALLPMAAGAALTTMGMPAGYAALTVGAASAATNGGDLRKGMMAGISAYGGAGMAESFMGAGLGTMGGAMGTSAAEAAPTVLATPAGATSPYALTGSTSAAPSAAKYSLGDPSSYLNKPLPSLVSTAPAEVARAAAAATPAAQQASALSSMDIGQRFNALKAGATGTNAMNYIKANPFTSLGVATAAMTPDENNTPQKAADTDRGPRAKLQYYSGYGTSLPAPNMQGIEQTYNRPYYAAEGGVTRMATGGITSAPRNQQQLFAEYLQRVSSSGVAAPPPTNKYDWWKSGGGSNTPATPPAETPEEYAERMRVNARGGGGGMSPEQRAEQAADNDKPQPMLNGLSRNEYFSLSPEEQNAVRAQADADNPKTATFLNAVKFVASPAKYLYDAFRGPEPASEMQKYIDVADAESRILMRDRAYEAYGNSIEGVTASDAAAAEAQRDQAEAANLARMQADTYPFGNFDDAPLSSRTDANYARQESELKSLERGLTPTSAQVKKGDPFAGFFSSDPTLNQIAKYGDPSTQPAGFFPTGTAYTDKAFFRDQYGNLFAPGDSIPARTTVSGNMALADQNKLQGLAQQRAIDASKLTVPDFTAISQADEAREKAEQAQQRAVEEIQKVATELGYMDKALEQDRDVLEGNKGLVFVDKYASLQDQLNKLDSAFGDRYAPVDKFALNQNSIEKFQQAKENLEPGDRFAPVNYSNQFLSPEAYQALTPYSAADEADRMFAAPDITPNVPDAISADPNADKTTETLGIPSAETFAAMVGAPFAQTAALNTGVVSDAGGYYGPLAGLQGGYNPGFGAPTTTSSGRGLAGLTASFGGLGSAWQGVVDRNGNPVLTSQGAAEKAFLGSPEGIQAANTEAAKTYSPPQDPAQRAESARQEAQAQQDARIAAFDASREGSRGGGGGMGGGDGGGFSGSGAAAGSSTGPAPGTSDGSNRGWGSRDAGGGDARGGYLQNGRFDQRMANGGLSAMANPYDLGSYSDGGRLLRGPGDGVSDSIPATIGKGRPARLADGEFVIPARIVSEIGNGSTDAGARKLYAMMDRIQAGRKKSVGKGKVAVNSRAYKHLPA